LTFIYGSREVLWSGIAGKLFEQSGAIRDALMRCEDFVRGRLGWSLQAVFTSENFDSEEVRGPSLTAMQIALTEGWRERGIEPDVIAGRSGGEYAAEYARGALVLEDAMEVVCRTSEFIRDRRGAGRMLAIRLGLSATQRLEPSSPVRFSIALDAEDDITIVACETHAAEKLREFLLARQIAHQILDSVMAFHSPAMDEWKSDLLKPLSGRARNSPLLPYYSAGADGRDDIEPYHARLWRMVREPAFVGRMLDNLIAGGCKVFLEIGGQPMLAARIRRRAAAAGKEVVTLPPRRSESVPALMDEAEEILRKSGVFIRPRRAAQSAPIWSSPMGVDLFSPQVRQDPYPTYAELRRTGAVHDPWQDVWLVARYADVSRVLSTPEIFSNAGLAAESTLLGADSTAHARVRNVVKQAFTSARIRAFDATIRAIVRKLLARVAAGAEWDLCEGLASPLPLSVIASMLDVDVARLNDVRRWVDAHLRAGVGSLTRKERRKAAEDIGECRAFLTDHVDRAASRRAGGCIGEFLAGTDGSDGLTRQEAADIGLLLLIAGTETTTNLIGNATLLLARDPPLQSRLRAHTELIAPFIEEVLRYESPVQRRLRVTTCPTRIGSARLPKGVVVQVLIGAANRDPEQFADPDQLQIERQPNRHLAFGSGPHFCLGSQLARLEASIALEIVLRQLPAFVRAKPREGIDYGTSLTVRGPRRLELAFAASDACV
jgi:cytochrome P450/malonyl CoA-acyl carrier protein transacylase